MQISKRYMAVTKELVQEHSELASYKENSLSVRHEIVMEWVPKLAIEAAEVAIKEWGGAKSDITHIVMSSASVVNMPGIDLLVANGVGLNSSKLRRVMMYYIGFHAGGAAVRIAKDLAKNNKGARLLVVCADCIASFRPPHGEYLDGLVGHGLFSDGAAALIVGADPCPDFERPVFEIQWARTTVWPDTLDYITGNPCEYGLYYHLNRNLSTVVSKNLEEALTEARELAGVESFNEMFLAMHPGGPAIMNKVEEEMRLAPEKLRASRQVLDAVSNIVGASVYFVLDRMRRYSIAGGLKTTGEGKDWGLLIGIGPGLTVESVGYFFTNALPTQAVSSIPNCLSPDHGVEILRMPIFL